MLLFSFPLRSCTRHLPEPFQASWVPGKSEAEGSRAGPLESPFTQESHSWTDTLASASPSVPRVQRCLLGAEGGVEGGCPERLSLSLWHAGTPGPTKPPGGDLGGQGPCVISQYLAGPREPRTEFGVWTLDQPAWSETSGLPLTIRGHMTWAGY